MSTAYWNVEVSRQTDDTLREVLTASGRTHEADLSRFVEDAVLHRIIGIEAEAAKRENAGRTEAEIMDAIEEALEWARRR